MGRLMSGIASHGCRRNSFDMHGSLSTVVLTTVFIKFEGNINNPSSSISEENNFTGVFWVKISV